MPVISDSQLPYFRYGPAESSRAGSGRLVSTPGWLYYEGPGGRHCLKDEFGEAALSQHEASRISMVMRRVATGANLKRDVKHLRGDIYEVRIDGDHRIFRLLFSREGSENVLLGLRFFGKKSAKTPQSEIDLANQRLRHWRQSDG